MGLLSAGKAGDKPYEFVPFFYSRFFDKSW